MEGSTAGARLAGRRFACLVDVTPFLLRGMQRHPRAEHVSGRKED